MPNSISIVAASLLSISLGALGASAQAPTRFDCTNPAADSPPAVPPPLVQILSGAALQAFNDALDALDRTQYEIAATDFARAYELSHEPRVLWNLVGVRRLQGRHALALELLTRYLESGTPHDPMRVCTSFNELQAQVSQLSIDVSEPDATISVRGEQMGRSPLPGPLLLDVGPAEISVQKQGFLPYATKVDLTPGAQPLAVTLQREAPPQPEQAREAPAGRAEIVVDPDATISIAGHAVGVGRWQGTLPSGTHHVSVSAPGKVPVDQTLAIEAGSLISLTVPPLMPLDDDRIDRPLVETPLFWVGIGTGAAAIAVTAYVLTRPDDARPAPRVDGTFTTILLPLQR